MTTTTDSIVVLEGGLVVAAAREVVGVVVGGALVRWGSMGDDVSQEGEVRGPGDIDRFAKLLGVLREKFLPLYKSGDLGRVPGANLTGITKFAVSGIARLSISIAVLDMSWSVATSTAS